MPRSKGRKANANANANTKPNASANTKTKTGMARLWELAGRKKFLVISSCVFSVLSVAVSFSPFIAIYYVIRELIAGLSGTSPLNTALLMRLGWLACAGAVAAIVLNFIALMFSHTAAFSTLYELKLEFTRHIAALPLGFHTAHSSGKLRKIVDENIEKLEGFIAHQLPDLVGSFAMPVVTLAILFFFDWRLGLASLVPIILSYLVQASAFGNKESQTFIVRYQDALEDMNNAAVEYVRGISVVKAFNQTIYSFRKFYDTIATYGKFCLEYTLAFETHMELFMLIVSQVYLFLIPVIIWLSGRVTDYPAFALACVFYLIFSVSLATPFVKLLYVSQISNQIADGIERMDAVLDTPPLPEIAPAQARTTTDYTLSFENVGFSYQSSEYVHDSQEPASGDPDHTRDPDHQEPASRDPHDSRYDGDQTPAPALNNVSFTAQQGAVTALVGPSGSGKSTIAHLIPRFYEVTSGAIRIGGVDIRDMSLDYLMSLVCFVFQDVYLFRQSVAANIAIGNIDATRAQIEAAARAAQCHDLIESLPQGYDTVIGADGVHLSGGQRQRIALARALLKDAPIIILDEATAFADPENERKIQQAFEQLIADKTVIIIAHRLSTVRNADKIIVIDKGALVEEGVHSELIERAEGRYRRMWEYYNRTLHWTLTPGNTPTPQNAPATI
ncbi:MAG: ABC transporter ATP-binding protein/permease [Actinomycetes bacterium]|jgi:ATP-binding cassette subfamily B protein|nr:ABC transporter ATP-binding protein/permease [Actinomycetes bacterium]